MPLHPHFSPDPRRVLECSECKNSSDSSPCTDTDWSTRTSTADTVREWWSVELEADTAVEGVPMIGELGRVPSAVRDRARRSGCMASGWRCARESHFVGLRVVPFARLLDLESAKEIVALVIVSPVPQMRPRARAVACGASEEAKTCVRSARHRMTDLACG